MGKRLTSRGCVYLFSVPGDCWKVGVAADPERRRRGLQIGNHEPITFVGATLPGDGPNAYDFERKVHELMRPFRIRGEWFRASEEIVTAVWAAAWEIESAAKIGSHA